MIHNSKNTNNKPFKSLNSRFTNHTESFIHSTTVIGMIHHNQVAIVSDGQATMGKTVIKGTVNKLRTLGNGTILTGFAGSTSDAITLFTALEENLESYNYNLTRAAVELAKKWSRDKYLRRLEALLAVLSYKEALIISGQGDVIEPDDQILAIGSGAMYALSSARALKKHAQQLSAREIITESLSIASDICIYTNNHINILELNPS